MGTRNEVIYAMYHLAAPGSSFLREYRRIGCCRPHSYNSKREQERTPKWCLFRREWQKQCCPSPLGEFECTGHHGHAIEHPTTSQWYHSFQKQTLFLPCWSIPNWLSGWSNKRLGTCEWPKYLRMTRAFVTSQKKISRSSPQDTKPWLSGDLCFMRYKKHKWRQRSQYYYEDLYIVWSKNHPSYHLSEDSTDIANDLDCRTCSNSHPLHDHSPHED